MTLHELDDCSDAALLAKPAQYAMVDRELEGWIHALASARSWSVS